MALSLSILRKEKGYSKFSSLNDSNSDVHRNDN